MAIDPSSPDSHRKNLRILGVLPIGYGDSYGFWPRDIGLLVLTLRALGYDAWLVALREPGQTPAPENPVIQATLEELADPAWWQRQKPDAVVLNTWSAPRFDALRQAALSATPRVVERLDTDGARSARLFPGPYFVQTWGEYANKHSTSVAWLLAAAKTSLLYAVPTLIDRPMVQTMTRIPALIAESPIAAERMRTMIRTHSPKQQRIEVIPHPVNDEVLAYNGIPKENRIITVGRWATVQKDFPMLQRVLRGFLQRHPDWQATIVGSGVPAGGIEGIGAPGRVDYHPRLDHEQLAVEYDRAKIYLMVSRHESFCIAAAEALCCGCSVVGSSAVPSSYYFAEPQSGSVAPTRTETAFLDTLDGEMDCWKRGGRIPSTIASHWRQRAGARAVAHAVLALLNDLPENAAEIDD